MVTYECGYECVRGLERHELQTTVGGGGGGRRWWCGWFCSFVPCCVGLTVNTLKTGALEEPTAADVEHDAAVVLHF